MMKHYLVIGIFFLLPSFVLSATQLSPNVTVQKLTRKEIHDTLLYPGVVMPRVSYDFFAPFSGTIKHRKVHEGEFINEGEIIIEVLRAPSYKESHMLRSPFSGTIISMTPQFHGSFAQGDLLLRVGELDSYTIQFHLPSNERDLLVENSESLSIIMHSNKVIPVSNLNIGAQVSSFGTYQATAVVASDSVPMLKVGDICTLQLEYQFRQSYLIPPAIIKHERNKQYLYYVEGNEKKILRKVVIETGSELYDNQYELKTQIEPESLFLFENYQYLKDGQEVTFTD